VAEHSAACNVLAYESNALDKHRRTCAAFAPLDVRMNDQPNEPVLQSPPPPPALPPRAQVRQKGAFSTIWLLPLLAAVIGAYLAYTTLSQRGPMITISLKSADGLSAGQTKVKHKAVELGTVERIRLAPDMSHVNVGVRMTREATPYLTENARFWVVRPRLSSTNISGLETLVSGAYIELDPGPRDGASQQDFTGLEDPPGVRSDQPGRTFNLQTGRIGSLASGSPVLYRDIVVGEVLGYELPEGNGLIKVPVFVKAPYDKWVRSGTHFWNASGLSVTLGGEGLHVEVASLQALLSGGVAFNTPEDARGNSTADDGATFPLYANENAAEAAGYKERLPFVSYFQNSAAGLSPGAQVQMYGIQIGNVTDVRLELDPAKATARVRVALEIQPERLQAVNPDPTAAPIEVAQRLVKQGMRTTLATQSYLTGQLLVSLDFVPDAPPAQVSREGDAIVLPSQLGNGVLAALSGVSQKLADLPLKQIGDNLNATIAALNAIVGSPELKQALGSVATTMTSVQDLVKKADAGATPLLKRLPDIANDLQSAVNRVNHLAGSVDTGYGQNSQFSRDLERVMGQLNDTARSIRLLADFLDRHPEALIRGRTGQAAER